MKWRGLFLTGALAAAFMFVGADTAQAHDNCSVRLNREEQHLQRDIRRHGFYSRQAQHRRQRIAELRRECYSRFGRRWDNDRDRDDRRWDNRRDRNDWRNRDRDRDRWVWDGRQWRRR